MSDQPPKASRQLTVTEPSSAVAAASAAVVVPGLIADAGEHATRRFLEFFAATIRNRNTRTAYLHAVGRFFAWCERHHVGELADIEPLHVAAYVEAIGKDFEKPTVKQHLAAIRMLFDCNRCGDRTYEFRARTEETGHRNWRGRGRWRFVGDGPGERPLARAHLGCGRRAEAVRLCCRADQGWRL